MHIFLAIYLLIALTCEILLFYHARVKLKFVIFHARPIQHIDDYLYFCAAVNIDRI